MHPVGHFARHPQHPRIHRRDIHFGIGGVNGPGAPLRSNEVEVVELAVVIECPGSERREARLHGEQVVAQPWARPIEGHAVTPHDVCAHLRAQTEPELPAGRFLKLPRRGRRDKRTTRKGHRDARGQLEAGRGLGGHGGVEIGRAARLGEQQAGESADWARRARSPIWLSGCGIVIASTCMVGAYVEPVRRLRRRASALAGRLDSQC